MIGKVISLYELNSIVKDVIDQTINQYFWVEAEVASARENKGHLYLELIQKDDSNNDIIAQANAICWSRDWYLISAKFQQITGIKVRAGIKIMVQVYARFHQRYGFSWNITDINSEYTMGNMARKRQEIIQRLKNEGIFDLQKDLSLSKFAQRIAIISSKTAAGYGDFINQLKNNNYGFAFTTELFPAIMQGDQVENTIINALNRIANKEDDFDVVVIIRGGGATADLTGFDTLQLAENIANFPLPIITGIGHERDESILDMIANKRAKTPTAAAEILIGNLANTLQIIDDAEIRLKQIVNEKLKYELLRIEKLTSNVRFLFSTMKAKEETRLINYITYIYQKIKEQLHFKHLNLEILSNKIKPTIQNKITDEKHRIESLNQRIEAINPQRLLKLGYSITYANGKIVKDTEQIKDGDELKTILQTGALISIVKKKINK